MIKAKRAAFLAVEPGKPMDPKLCCKETIGALSLFSKSTCTGQERLTETEDEAAVWWSQNRLATLQSGQRESVRRPRTSATNK